MTKAVGKMQKREKGKIPGWAIRKKKTNGLWADLPQELLDLISKDLNIADYLSFGGVCRSWRLFYSEYKQRFMASQSPLIVYMSISAEDSCYFYDIIRFKSNKYKTKLLNFSCHFKFCIGVSSGYLIMTDLVSSYFWLINPVTGHQLKFSSMLHPLSPSSAAYIDRAIFASIGSDRDQDFLLVILSKKLRNLHFCRSRDNQWKVYSYYGKPWRILDIVAFCGRIYAITSDFSIGILHLASSDLKFLKLRWAPRLSCSVKLVACRKQLFIVDFGYGEQVKIYKIRFSKMKWAEVNNLGEQALFLGKQNTMWSQLINPTRWGGTSNCVYHLSNNNHCDLYSLNGEFLQTIPVVRGYLFPLAYSWYFLNQSSGIDNIKDD